MTTPTTRTSWPTAGLGLVAGSALGLLVGILAEWPLAVSVVTGAGLGLVAGALMAAQRPET